MTIEKPEISIITPTYNRAKLLPRMVKSVINQTIKNWELIIMDDGSTDNTAEIIYQFNDERIKFHSGINSGAADKRNNGVQLAKSEYIIFLDSDDEVKTNWLELLLSAKNQNGSIIVSCGLEFHDIQGQIKRKRLPKPLAPMYGGLNVIFLAGSFMLKKEIFQSVGGYDKNLKAGQHTNLLFQLLPILKENVEKIAFVKKALVIIHSHEGFKIRNDYNSVLQGNMSIMEKHKHLFSKNPDEYFDYLSATAVLAVKCKDYKLSQQLFLKAIKTKPHDLQSYLRFVISWFPKVRNIIWS